MDHFLINSLPDGCIGLKFFEGRTNFLKRNIFHVVMSKNNDRNNVVVWKENALSKHF